MTEEQKQHQASAEKFAASLGAAEGAMNELGGWKEEAREDRERRKRDAEDCLLTREVQRREGESAIAERARAAALHETEHGIWKAEIENVQKHRATIEHVERERTALLAKEVDALYRIAAALEGRK